MQKNPKKQNHVVIQIAVIDMEISRMLPKHWEDVKRIYEEGIATGNATFQTSAPSWEEWNNSHLPSCRLIAVDANKVIGWGCAHICFRTLCLCRCC